MPYEITEQVIDPTNVLFIRREVAQEELAATFAEVLPAVFGYAMGSGFELAGPPFARYPEMADRVTVEAGCPVGAAATGSGDIQSGVIPGGLVATTIHTGPYEELGNAYDAIDRWLTERGHVAEGVPWESYLTDPGEVADPKDWQTAVFRPFAKQS